MSLGHLIWSAELPEHAARAIGQSVMDAAIDCRVDALSGGHSLPVCGNGGSPADPMHITGELLARTPKARRTFRAIRLSGNPVLTSPGNDCSYETVFARQVEACGEGTVLRGLRTSATPRHVAAAFEQVRRRGMPTIALTGEYGGTLAPPAGSWFAVPSRNPPVIKQVYLRFYHYLCERVERRFATV